MQANKEELTHIFRNFSDEELLRRWRSGNMTELAKELATQELSARNILPSSPKANQHASSPIAATNHDAKIQAKENAGIEVESEAETEAETEAGIKAKIEPETNPNAEPEQPEIAQPASAGGNEFATVASFSLPFDAHVLRAQLEAEGLFVTVSDEHLLGANQFLAPAIGGVRVRVLKQHLLRAEEIMRATQAGALTLPKDPDEAEAAPALPPLEAALLAYAQDPYWLKSWRRLIDKRGTWAGFNWGAMLFGMTWCMYRKMYMAGVIVFLLEIFITEKLGLFWPWLAVRVLLGGCGNIVYYMQAMNAVEKLQGENEETMQKQLKRVGGINMGAAIAGLGLAVWSALLAVAVH